MEFEILVGCISFLFITVTSWVFAVVLFYKFLKKGDKNKLLLALSFFFIGLGWFGVALALINPVFSGITKMTNGIFNCIGVMFLCIMFFNFYYPKHIRWAYILSIITIIPVTLSLVLMPPEYVNNRVNYTPLHLILFFIPVLIALVCSVFFIILGFDRKLNSIVRKKSLIFGIGLLIADIASLLTAVASSMGIFWIHTMFKIMVASGIIILAYGSFI